MRRITMDVPANTIESVFYWDLTMASGYDVNDLYMVNRDPRSNSVWNLTCKATGIRIGAWDRRKDAVSAAHMLTDRYGKSVNRVMDLTWRNDRGFTPILIDPATFHDIHAYVATLTGFIVM